MNNQGFVCYRLPFAQEWQAHTLTPTKTEGFKFVFHPFEFSKHPALELFSQQELLDNEEIEQFFLKFYNTKELDPLDFNAKSESRYLKMVEDAISFLKNDATEKIVLSRGVLYQKKIENPFQVFKTLCYKHPQAFVYYFQHPHVGTWVGATPELLLEVSQGKLSTMSLAGTKSNSKDKPEWTSKELEEQAIVTSAIIEVLEKHGVKNLQRTLPFDQIAGGVTHLRTDILGEINPNNNVYELAKALHPTPATCGQPKTEALEYIKKNEGYDRAYYTGFIGIETPEITRFFVNLRCMQLFKNHLIAYAGGGITQYSQPKAEWNETVNKLQTMLNALSHD